MSSDSPVDKKMKKPEIVMTTLIEVRAEKNTEVNTTDKNDVSCTEKLV